MSPEKDPIVIAAAARTPMGGMLGELTPLAAHELGAVAIADTLTRSGVEKQAVDEIIMGNVLSAGQGQAPARQASLGAGLPQDVGCTTINKMCGSGMKATMLAHDLIRAGSARIMIAGGMESMSNAPYLLAKARGGYRLGHGEIKDHMFLDGLEDAYDRGKPMGFFAEATADHYGFSRQAQDEFAIASLSRAQAAGDDGRFAAEIAAVTISDRRGETRIVLDEQPRKGRPDKIPSLRPVFRADGTVTAANSSSISDGAAALLLMPASEAEARGLTPLARIVGHATHAQAPAWFTTAPVAAMRKLLERNEWSVDSVDLWEVNEAFAVVTMAAMRELGLPHEAIRVDTKTGLTHWCFGRPHYRHPAQRPAPDRRAARRGIAVHRWRRSHRHGF